MEIRLGSGVGWLVGPFVVVAFLLYRAYRIVSYCGCLCTGLLCLLDCCDASVAHMIIETDTATDWALTQAGVVTDGPGPALGTQRSFLALSTIRDVIPAEEAHEYSTRIGIC